MARQRHLSRAPIREAIIDIKVSPTVDLARLQGLYQEMKAQYPSQEDVREGAFGFSVNEGKVRSKAVDHGIRGKRLRSSDGRYVLLLRVDGFTFSCLPPYATWESMRDAARPLWDRYVAQTEIQTITRAALRYVNLMDLPLPIKDFGDYLTAPPVVPPSLPQQIVGFVSRIVVVAQEFGGAAVITQTLESATLKSGQVLLDIDVFRELPDDSVANDGSVWTCLEAMRHFKNRVFFESITERTADLFQ